MGMVGMGERGVGWWECNNGDTMGVVGWECWGRDVDGVPGR